jgi:molybdopterin-guanine dinucleotide biosynthesis protein A
MGTDKAALDLDGRPLIAHVIERLAPQVETLVINADHADRFAGFGAPVVPDAVDRLGAGPMAGIAAALAYAKAAGFDLLATAPCDAPFLPLDLVARLLDALTDLRAPAAVAVSARGVEPMFALWRVAILPEAIAALASGEASPRKLFARSGAAYVEFVADDEANVFANLNTPDQLAAARDRLKAGRDPTPA